jgi:hypothetical protein
MYILCISPAANALISALMYISSITRDANAILLCMRHCTQLSGIFCLSHQPLMQYHCLWDTALSSHVYYVYLTSRSCNATVYETLQSVSSICNLSQERLPQCYSVWENALNFNVYFVYLTRRCYSATVYETLISSLMYILSISRDATAMLLCMSQFSQLSCIFCLSHESLLQYYFERDTVLSSYVYFVHVRNCCCSATVYETYHSALMYILSISRATTAMLLCMKHCTELSCMFCLSHLGLLQCYCVWDNAFSCHVYYFYFTNRCCSATV